MLEPIFVKECHRRHFGCATSIDVATAVFTVVQKTVTIVTGSLHDSDLQLGADPLEVEVEQSGARVGHLLRLCLSEVAYQ